MVQNTKRIDEIKQSFDTIASGDLDSDNQNIIDGQEGVEVRKKLLNILNLVLDAPDNLIRLKNLTSSIVKINESQIDMSLKNNEIKDKVKFAKREMKDNRKSLSSIKKEIEIHINQDDQEENNRQ